MGVGLPQRFLFVITLVVFIHELGHILVARLCGVTVETFSIGFGREIFGLNDRHGTRWKLSWIPLGGYVKFTGDADASSRPDSASLQRMDSSAREGALHFKPLYQRALVAAAGPIANFILAIVIFAGVILTYGKPAEPPIVEAVTPGSAAEIAGIRAGDTIRSVGGETIHVFSDLQRIVGANSGHSLHVVIARNGRDVGLDVVPTPSEVTDASGVKRSFVPPAGHCQRRDGRARGFFEAAGRRRRSDVVSSSLRRVPILERSSRVAKAPISCTEFWELAPSPIRRRASGSARLSDLQASCR